MILISCGDDPYSEGTLTILDLDSTVLFGDGDDDDDAVVMILTSDYMILVVL